MLKLVIGSIFFAFAATAHAEEPAKTAAQLACSSAVAKIEENYDWRRKMSDNVIQNHVSSLLKFANDQLQAVWAVKSLIPKDEVAQLKKHVAKIKELAKKPPDAKSAAEYATARDAIRKIMRDRLDAVETVASFADIQCPGPRQIERFPFSSDGNGLPPRLEDLASAQSMATLSANFFRSMRGECEWHSADKSAPETALLQPARSQKRDYLFDGQTIRVVAGTWDHSYYSDDDDAEYGLLMGNSIDLLDPSAKPFADTLEASIDHPLVGTKTDAVNVLGGRKALYVVSKLIAKKLASCAEWYKKEKGVEAAAVETDAAVPKDVPAGTNAPGSKPKRKRRPTRPRPGPRSKPAE